VAGYDLALEQALAAPTAANLALLVGSESRLTQALLQPAKVELGLVGATPGSLRAIRDAAQISPRFLLPHRHGEWGELDPFDRRQNELALLRGDRLLSAYRTRLGEKLWVITEADRGATTLLLPEEY